MERTRSAIRFWLAALLCSVIAASVSGEIQAGRKKEDKDNVEKRAFQILKPSVDLSPAEGYAAAQEIGGVGIELSYRPFTVKPMYFVSVQERSTMFESLTGVRVGTAAPVYIGVLPFYQVDPENVKLGLKITNHLGRVLRLEGVALQFVKDGESLATDTAANPTLNKLIILPEKSWEGTLEGPPLTAFGLKEFDARTTSAGLLEGETVASEGVLLVGIYDVITEVDEASAPKKRSNFEWVFSYAAKAVPETAEALRWKAKLTPEIAAKIIGEHSPEDFSAMLPGESVPLGKE